MTLPKAIARANRIGINQVTRHFAGRVPPFAMLLHRGRRSGREYRTPIMTFRCGDTLIIALTYGPDTDWVRNLRVAGGGALLYRGERYELREPTVIDTARAAPCLPPLVRAALRVMRVGDFLQVRAAAERGA
jgi:deazaflavin-dependent oxidoreductase (nitroreductase family)